MLCRPFCCSIVVNNYILRYFAVFLNNRLIVVGIHSHPSSGIVIFSSHSLSGGLDGDGCEEPAYRWRVASRNHRAVWAEDAAWRVGSSWQLVPNTLHVYGWIPKFRSLSGGPTPGKPIYYANKLQWFIQHQWNIRIDNILLSSNCCSECYLIFFFFLFFYLLSVTSPPKLCNFLLTFVFLCFLLHRSR